MNIQTEKLKLIEWLAGLNDQTLIERIKYLKEHADRKDWWEDLTETEKAAIDQGIADAENGYVTGHEEVKKRYEKYL